MFCKIKWINCNVTDYFLKVLVIDQIQFKLKYKHRKVMEGFGNFKYIVTLLRN